MTALKVTIFPADFSYLHKVQQVCQMSAVDPGTLSLS